MKETLELKAREAQSEYEKTLLRNEILRLRTDNAAFIDRTNEGDLKIEELQEQIKNIDSKHQGGTEMINLLVSKLK